jgi:SAM-dependent methyltransferase
MRSLEPGKQELEPEMTDLPRLYGDLAKWWPLVSAPAEYAEEAEVYREVLVGAAQVPVSTVLELGSGGGNNASHLKAHFRMTLVDRSPGMLKVSRELNPDCEHHLGDMRTARLGAEFDAVFVHDAVDYLTTLADLRAAMRTAFEHCRSGGAALFVPDHLKESFRSGTNHGGHDGDGRGMRYLEWTRDPDPDDSTYVTDFAYLLYEEGAGTSVLYDRHMCGLFSRDEWLRTLGEVGFDGRYEEATLTAGEVLRMFVGVNSV